MSGCWGSVQVWECLGLGLVSRYGSVWVLEECPGMGVSGCRRSVRVWECLGVG